MNVLLDQKLLSYLLSVDVVVGLYVEKFLLVSPNMDNREVLQDVNSFFTDSRNKLVAEAGDFDSCQTACLMCLIFCCQSCGS